MHFPRLPDWLVYLAVVAALLFAALGRREHADAPAAPPPSPGGGAVLLPPASPFDTTVQVDHRATAGPRAGTAFSVADRGVWITARHVAAGCRRLAIVIADRRGVAATILASSGEIAVLTTRGGGPALPLAAPDTPERGQRAFHPGFPGGGPGEIASRLIGRWRMTMPGSAGAPKDTLIWAQDGRTAGLSNDLTGLSGAPALDAAGRVVGVTLAQAPRRGRIYTTTLADLRRAMAAAGVGAQVESAGEPITPENYGQVADELRRTLSVAPVVCLAG